MTINRTIWISFTKTVILTLKSVLHGLDTFLAPENIKRKKEGHIYWHIGQSTEALPRTVLLPPQI